MPSSPPPTGGQRAGCPRGGFRGATRITLVPLRCETVRCTRRAGATARARCVRGHPEGARPQPHCQRNAGLSAEPTLFVSLLEFLNSGRGDGPGLGDGQGSEGRQRLDARKKAGAEKRRRIFGGGWDKGRCQNKGSQAAGVFSRYAKKRRTVAGGPINASGPRQGVRVDVGGREDAVGRCYAGTGAGVWLSCGGSDADVSRIGA
jgi:hypothetical protein